MSGVAMSRPVTKVIVAAVLALAAVTATGCVPTATSVVTPPDGVAAG